MLIQMPIVVAHKADCAAADGVGLTVKDMDARAMLNNHDFMKIMMMLRESRLRQPRLYRHRRTIRRKKVHAVQYGHNAPHQ
ncbi:hypothetical protein OUHCRE12_37070 [Enterobacter kobei]